MEMTLAADGDLGRRRRHGARRLKEEHGLPQLQPVAVREGHGRIACLQSPLVDVHLVAAEAGQLQPAAVDPPNLSTGGKVIFMHPCISISFVILHAMAKQRGGWRDNAVPARACATWIRPSRVGLRERRAHADQTHQTAQSV
jgi:hypothetical protein